MILELAKELRARGHSVLPVGLSNGTGWLGARFVAAGFEPASFELDTAARSGGCARAHRRSCATFGADVVHSHEFTMADLRRRRREARQCASRDHHARRPVLRHRVAPPRRAALGHAPQRCARWRVRCDRERARSALSASNDRSSTSCRTEFRCARACARALRSELALAPGELLIVSVGNLYAGEGTRGAHRRAGHAARPRRLAPRDRRDAAKRSHGFAHRPRRRASAIACISSAFATMSPTSSRQATCSRCRRSPRGCRSRSWKECRSGCRSWSRGVGGVPEVVTDGVEGADRSSVGSRRARGCPGASCSRMRRCVSRWAPPRARERFATTRSRRWRTGTSDSIAARRPRRTEAR